MTDYVDCGDGVATISVNFGHFSLPSTMLWLPFGFSFHLQWSAVDSRTHVMVMVLVVVVAAAAALNYEYLSKLSERYQCGPHEMMPDLRWYVRCPSVLAELENV